MIPSLQLKYKETVISGMQEKYSYKNVMEIPKLDKIVVNVGMGKAISSPKLLDSCLNEIATITGQKPIMTKAKKSEAAFKLRAGMNIGCKVTLRNKNMFYFLGRLIDVAIPRIRDFRGFSRKAFDGKGNYSLGIKEQLIFPEIKYDDILESHGMNICIVTTAKTNEEALTLMEIMGFPFRK